MDRKDKKEILNVINNEDVFLIEIFHKDVENKRIVHTVYFPQEIKHKIIGGDSND